MRRTAVTYPLLAAFSVLLAGACDSPSEAITIYVPSATLEAVGDSRQMEATVRGSDRLPEWTISDPAVATVTRAGMVTAVAAGTAQLTARVSGIERSATVTVLPPVNVEAYNLRMGTNPQGRPELALRLRNQAGRGYYRMSVWKAPATEGGQPVRVVGWETDSPAPAGFDISTSVILENGADWIMVHAREPNSLGYTRTSCVRVDGQPGCPM